MRCKNAHTLIIGLVVLHLVLSLIDWNRDPTLDITMLSKDQIVVQVQLIALRILIHLDTLNRDLLLPKQLKDGPRVLRSILSYSKPSCTIVM